MNENLKVAFDVDGTLVLHTDGQSSVPRYDVLNILFTYQRLGASIYVWSGGGVDYACDWQRKLGLSLDVCVVAKGSFIPDIAYDDQEVKLGKVNIRV